MIFRAAAEKMSPWLVREIADRCSLFLSIRTARLGAAVQKVMNVIMSRYEDVRARGRGVGPLTQASSAAYVLPGGSG